jgi:uncharacterized membrane protein
MASPASVARHPIHPMLVVFPIGLWVFALVCDLVFAFGGGPIWKDLAFYTIAGGIVGALLAAVPGLVDYRGLRSPRVRRTALTHMVLNVVVLALFALNLWLRTRLAIDSVVPLVLSLIGVGLLGISGWLGGELVYVHGVGVEEPSGATGRRDRSRAA